MPSEFLWGAATSAHQVEGNNIHNDWWDWEQRTPGAHKSGLACDHYNRYAEDFALVKSLGHNAHRLSLEWSRIEPAYGQWNGKAVEHYRGVLSELRRQGMKSFVTLHHFTNPIWLARQGGWLNERSPELFARYAEEAVRQLGDLVDAWITINEPMVYATHGYWHKKWPPQHRSLREMLKVIRHMAQGHEQAYRVIHKIIPGARVGIAKSVVTYLPERQQWDDRAAAAAENWWYNHRFLRMTRGTHDFIGINYYFASKKRVQLWPPQFKTLPWSGPKTDMDWPICPEGLERALLDMKQYGVPLYITENGIADANDKLRADYIRDHLRAVERAQAQGADVRGYFYWSLLDNFEWAAGYGPRFGLVEVDFETQERKPRASAYVYKAIIEQAKREARDG